jgi:hypothetical protein
MPIGAMFRQAPRLYYFGVFVVFAFSANLDPRSLLNELSKHGIFRRISVDTLGTIQCPLLTCTMLTGTIQRPHIEVVGRFGCFADIDSPDDLGAAAPSVPLRQSLQSYYNLDNVVRLPTLNRACLIHRLPESNTSTCSTKLLLSRRMGICSLFVPISAGEHRSRYDLSSYLSKAQGRL